MTDIFRPTRRAFTATLAALPLMVAPALARARPRLVIVGGGPGGVAAARLLHEQFDVTLVSGDAGYTALYRSNLLLAGMIPPQELRHGYGPLAALGLKVVPRKARSIDRARRLVEIGPGEALPYDRLILAPGIGLIDGSVPGWSQKDAALMPHAFLDGREAVALAKRLPLLPEGAVIGMVMPPEPYRCPPGPYERATAIAAWLKRHNPSATLLIADPKEEFSKQPLFEQAWLNHYPGMIERIDPDFGGDQIEIRPQQGQMVIDGEPVDVDLCNVIPAQQSAPIVRAAGLAPEGGWAPVDPLTMRSTEDPDIFVLGDAAAGMGAPKSAIQAVQGARAAAAALLEETAPTTRSNICWSVLSADNAVYLDTRYRVDAQGIHVTDVRRSGLEDSHTARAQNLVDAEHWRHEFNAETFGD